MTSAGDAIRNYIVEQSIAYQRDSLDESSSAADDAREKATMTRARKVSKELQVIGLNYGLESLTIEAGEEDEVTSIESEVANVLLEYFNAVLATNVKTTTDGVQEKCDTADAMIEWVAALAIQVGGLALEAVVGHSVDIAKSAMMEGVRAMSCAILGRVAAYQSLKKNSSDERMELEWMSRSMSSALVPRLTDKSTAVRGAAIVAASSVLEWQSTGQWNDNDDQEELLEAWLWNLWHDPSVTNRTLAVQSISGTNPSLYDHAISRLRDVKEKVRIAALDTLTNKIQLESLSSEQMAEIIRSGLSVRCEATKAATHSLICTAWLKSAKFNAVRLLELMDAVTYEQEAEQMIRALFYEQQQSQQQEGNKNVLSSLSAPEIRAFQKSITEHLALEAPKEGEALSISPEQAFLFKMICSAPNTQDSFVEESFMDIDSVCNLFQFHSLRLVEAIASNNELLRDNSCFLCSQILVVASHIGQGEEGSRRRLTGMLQRLLSSSTAMPDDLVEGALQALAATCDSQSELIHNIDIIVEALQNETDITPDDVNAVEFAALRTVRILSIVSIVLEKATPSRHISDLLAKIDKMVIDAAVGNSASSLTREAAVSCLGKMGLFVEENVLLSDYKPRLLKIASNESDSLEIRSQAMLALADWAMVFSDIFKPCSGQEGEQLSFLDVLQDFMQSTNDSVVSIAAEASAKLLFAGRIIDSGILAQLLVVFFHPRFNQESTGGENQSDLAAFGRTARCQQLLSLFFPAYCLRSPTTGREALIGSIQTALTLAMKAKAKTKGTAGKKGRSVAFPVVKMVEYICSIVAVSEEMLNNAEAENMNTSLSGTEQAADMEDDQDSKTALMIAIELGNFLLSSLGDDSLPKQSQLNLTQLRGICQLLGGLHVYDSEKRPGVATHESLVKLQEIMEESGMLVTDSTALRALTPLMEELAGVEELEIAEESPEETSDLEEDLSDDKENTTHRLSTSSAKIGSRMSTENRVSLGASNTVPLF